MRERGSRPASSPTLDRIDFGPQRDDVSKGRLHGQPDVVVATLRKIESAQRQLRALGSIDCDGDGTGEYGFLAELAGTSPLRTDEWGGVGLQPLWPALLPKPLGNVASQCAMQSGYLFQIYLPNSTCNGVAEAVLGGAYGVSIAAGEARRYWCAYAWPVAYGKTGMRVFFVNQQGILLAAPNQLSGFHYEGLTTSPPATTAFRAGTTGSIDCPIAADTFASDGQRWSKLR